MFFSLQNAEPAAFIENAEKFTDSKRKRRVALTPDEWNDSFGEEFYEYALDNSFYYLAPKTNWNSNAKSIVPPGVKQLAVMSPDELQASIEDLRTKVDTINLLYALRVPVSPWGAKGRRPDDFHRRNGYQKSLLREKEQRTVSLMYAETPPCRMHGGVYRGRRIKELRQVRSCGRILLS